MKKTWRFSRECGRERFRRVIYVFGDCELDTERFELRRGGMRQHVEPQVFDVLVYLIAHRGRVVRREELLAQVWGHSYVSEATLSSRVMAARKAIGDSGRAQSLIRTVRGRGYELAADVEERHAAPPARAATAVFGRADDLAELHRLLDSALAGARQLALVTGEAGAGKTTLAEGFLEEAAARRSLLVARGRCLDYHGPAEPYGPVLEALGALGRSEAGHEVVHALAHFAPSWLVQLPGLAGPDELEAARERAFGAGPERMLREMVEGLEALCAIAPVVLFLDDLHWGDRPTLALLAHLARRDEAARLLVVGTSRPSSGSGVDELRRELRPRGRCVELALSPLAPAAVHSYLESRYPGAETLAGSLHRRTDGNPLFMECLVRAWVDSGALARTDGKWQPQVDEETLALEVPETLRELLEQELERVAPGDERILEAAAVVGTEFSAAAAAAGAGLDPEAVEQRCAMLARGGRFLRERGTEEWPDGTLAAAFAFVHDLHRQVLYERISAGRRMRLHRNVAARLERGHGREAPGRAAELATHFVHARESPAAARYLELAAAQAFALGAYREGVDHLRTALDLIARTLELPDRAGQELSLQTALGFALLVTEGFATGGAEAALRRALELARQRGDNGSVAHVLHALAAIREFAGDYRASSALLDEALHVEGIGQDAAKLIEVHELMACSLFHQGRLDAAVAQADRGLRFHQPEERYPVLAFYGEHPAVSCHDWAGLALWCLGYPDEALARIEAALELAGEPGREHSLASAQKQAARLRQMRREPERCLRHAEATLALSHERGHHHHGAVGRILLGWALAAVGRHDEGVEQLREGLAAHGATGAAVDHPYFLGLLAEAEQAAGRVHDALAAVGEAMRSVGPNQSFFYEPELHRLLGVLTLEAQGRDGADAAVACLRRALDLARAQRARSFELRAAVSLSRALRERRAGSEALEVLVQTSSWFGEEVETPELREARALTAELTR
jgi:DNA-binding winged helix-turn-helix (wHTH) protein/predicted ATPase